MKSNYFKYVKTSSTIFFCFVFTFQVFAQAPEFWGMTRVGGEFNAGTIFKTDENGNTQSVEYSFTQNEGKHPNSNRLCQANNGKFYGMSTEGGADRFGVLFEYDPITKVYIKMVDFGTTNGAYPYGGLLLASNGKLYGTASQGGAIGYGILFEYDTETHAHTIKADFNGKSNGRYPLGTLLQASNGKLYGTTSGGGITQDDFNQGNGTLFEYNIETSTLTKLADFVSDSSGATPGGLIEVANGKLYGVARQGGHESNGNLGDGVLFEFDILDSALVPRVYFDNINKGKTPHGGLLEATNGKLYGTTFFGGTNGEGVLFEYDVDTEVYTKKHNFDGGEMGENPKSSLIQLSDGKILGTTQSGGVETYGGGVIFEYDPVTDILSSRYEFDDSGIMGKTPEAALLLAANGKLYGATSFGGTRNMGVLFEFDPLTNTYLKEFDFEGWPLGATPHGDLVLATNGKYYGTCRLGGAFGLGTLFEFDPASNSLMKKVDFEGDSIGKNPEGNLIQASNGKLYGLTSRGSPDYSIVLFEYDLTTSTFLSMLNEVDELKGQEPHGSLLEAANGKLYGLTNGGGTLGKGILFEYDINSGSLTKKFDFDGSNNGANPLDNLIQANNGMLYGMTRFGGSSSSGTLFEYEIGTNTFTKKIDFDGDGIGSVPKGSLMQASNDKLYGMTSTGGANDFGVLFEYNTNSNDLISILDFDGTNSGANPDGSLIQAANGNLYGLTLSGGTSNDGVLFELDPVTYIYTKKLDFEEAIGYQPYGSLIKVNTSSVNIESHHVDLLETSVYPNPASTTLSIRSSLVIDRIELYTVLGEKVLESERTSEIEVNSLSKGVYILQFYTEKGKGSRRIIVDH